MWVTRFPATPAGGPQERRDHVEVLHQLIRGVLEPAEEPQVLPTYKPGRLGQLMAQARRDLTRRETQRRPRPAVPLPAVEWYVVTIRHRTVSRRGPHEWTSRRVMRAATVLQREQIMGLGERVEGPMPKAEALAKARGLVERKGESDARKA